MQVIGVSTAPIFNQIDFDDNYVRTFRKVPEFSKAELKMLKDWLKKDQLGEIAIFLTGEKYRAMDEEMAQFVIRELLRGNL
jgi:hypothetical protein